MASRVRRGQRALFKSKCWLLRNFCCAVVSFNLTIECLETLVLAGLLD